MSSPSARRASRLLRSARRGPWGKGRNTLTGGMEPVYAVDENGREHICHYRLVTDPWYVNRTGFYRAGSQSPTKRCRLIGCNKGHHLSRGSKAKQRWLKDIELAGRWDVQHALSDCCGWGNDDGHGAEPEPYPFVSGSVPPQPVVWKGRIVRQRRGRRGR